MTWGAILPHGAAGELDGLTGVEAWGRLRDAAAAYDELGYDHLWMSDHLMTSLGDRTGNYFEGYSALAALTQVTTRARLGAMVTCALYRSVAMLAKQGAAVDVMSGGRFILALGGGWDEGEFAAFGLPFPSPAERVAIFGETLEALRLLWNGAPVDYAGEHVRLDGASCTPRPATPPPIWTGTHGPRGLRHAARFADVANWNVGLTQFRELSAQADAACADVGRDPATLERSVFRLGELSGNDDRLLQIIREQGAPDEALSMVKDDHFIGTPDEVIGKVQAFVDAGARHVVVLFLDSGETDLSAQRFMTEVVPAVRTPRSTDSPGT